MTSSGIEMVGNERGPLRQVAQSLGLGLFVAGVAVAAITLSRWHPRGQRVEAPPGVGPKAQRPPAPSLAQDQRLVPLSPEPAPAEAPQNIPAPSASHKFLDPLLGATANTASALFAAANSARVRGDTPAAIALSQRLEAEFPSSSEGIATHLSLGVLFLQQGQPTAALEQFKIYRHIGASAGMAEALWGASQALQELGRAAEERAALQELLHNYPRSAYAAAAQTRLNALN